MTRSCYMLVLGVFSWSIVQAAAAQSSSQKPVVAAWTEMVGDNAVAADPQPTGHVVVRAITEGATCPVATVDGMKLPMKVRQAASASFPVITCQATPSAGARNIQVGGIHLAAKPAKLQRIIVLGDTGCRLKGAQVQDCNDVRRWPFPLVAAHAAAKHPDLVIHVGDYYYRESPCPPNDAGCAGSPHGDQWESWNADLFQPVGPLLTAAPWIFTRGNHEQCGRGADGWFRFLDAAAMPQRCEDSITAPPFTIRIDGLTMNVMDSADTDDGAAPEKLVAIFTKQYEQLGNATETGHGWIITHRPIWGLDPKVPAKPKPGRQPVDAANAIAPALPGYNAVDFKVNVTEQVASDSRSLSGTDMVLGGHVHLFTALSYGATRPGQLIVGNGGDEPAMSIAGPAIRTETIDGKLANLYQIQRYGYLMMDRTKDGWLGTVFSVDDEIMGTCTFIARTASCLVSPTLPAQPAASSMPPTE